MDSPVINFSSEAVARGRQLKRTFKTALVVILQTVDERLRVFDPNADSKRFLLKSYSPVVKEVINVSRRMARRENDRIPGKLFLSDPDSFDRIAGDLEVSHLGPKTNFTACSDDGVPDCFDDVGKQI